MKLFFASSTFIQFCKYVLMGVTNTLLDLAVYLALTRFINFFETYIFLAKAISFFVAATWSFFGNRQWTFQRTTSITFEEISKYYAVACVNACINVGVDYISVRLFGLPDTIAIIIAAAATVVLGFILNKWWVFSTRANVV